MATSSGLRSLPPLTAEQGMRVVKMVAGASIEMERGELKQSLDENSDTNRAIVRLRASLGQQKAQAAQQKEEEKESGKGRPPNIMISKGSGRPANQLLSPGTLLVENTEEKNHSLLVSNKVVPVGDAEDVLRRTFSMDKHAAFLSEYHLAIKAGLKPQDYNKTSLGFLTLKMRFRIFCIKLAEWVWFDRFILGVIFLNTASLAAFDPLDLPSVHPVSSKRNFLDSLSLVFSVIFWFEFLLKVLSYGFCFGKGAYLKSTWNWLDFFIVVISIFDFLPGGSGSNLSSIRTFRVLRPLRAITRFHNLRFLVRLLLQCIPMLMNVVGLCFFIFFVFGILGVQLWAGNLRNRCYSADTGVLLDANYLCSSGVTAFHICPAGYNCLPLYDNPHYGATNFDDILAAIVTIFQVMTYEGWSMTMYLVMDGFSAAAALYFHILIFVGPIFAIQLFLVVISSKFSESRAKQALIENEFGGRTQKKAVAAWRSHPVVLIIAKWLKEVGKRMRSMSQAVRRKFAWLRHTSFGASLLRFESLVEKFASSKVLSDFITGVIMVNTIFMALDHDCDLTDPASYCHDFSIVMECANLLFTTIFTLEMAVKLIGLGPIGYVSDAYNVFDGLIVAISLAEVEGIVEKIKCLLFTFGPAADGCDGGGRGLGVLRTFRLVRVLKLLRAFPSLQRQVKIVVDLLSSVSALMVLILLLLGIFAILGMNLFGGNWNPADATTVKLGSRVVVQVPGVDDLLQGRIANIAVNNVTGIDFVVRLLYDLSDGRNDIPAVLPLDTSSSLLPQNIIVGYVPRQNFDSLLYASLTALQILTQEDYEFIYYTTSRSHGMWSALYFLGLIVIGNYMMLNLFIAIIIQGFADQPTDASANDDDDTRPLTLLERVRARIAEKVKQLFASLKTKFMPKKVVPEKPISAVFGAMSRLPLDSLPHGWDFAQSNVIRTTRSRLTMAIDDDYLEGDNVTSRSGSPDNSSVLSGVASPVRRIGSGLAGSETGDNISGVVIAAPESSPNPSVLGTDATRRIIPLDLESPAMGGGGEGDPMTAATPYSGARSPFSPGFDSSSEIGDGPASVLKQALQQKKLAFNLNSAKKTKVSPAPSVAGDPEGTGETENEEEDIWDDGEDEEDDSVLRGHSLFCLSSRNWFRNLAFTCISHKVFDNIILFCIFMSSLALAMERPGIVGKEKMFLEYLNLALNIMFLLEMILKVISHNFFVYFSSHWNKLDFFIVATSVVDFVIDQASGGGKGLQALRILRIFRIFRALRPLRVISRARGLRIVLLSMTGSVKPIFNTLFIAGMVYLVFGILGVQLFGGNMHYCSDNLVFRKTDCVGTALDGSPRVWLNSNQNFDNIGEAMQIMFMISAIDGWPSLMWAGVDTTSKYTGPKEGSNELFCLYYVICLFVTGFLVINIFVGVFVDNFNQAAKKVNASLKIRMRSRKRKVVALGDLVAAADAAAELAVQNDIRQTTPRLFVANIVSNTTFDMGIALCIALNIVCMSFESYLQGQWQQVFLAITNYFFTFVFGLEAVMKLFAFRAKTYFSSNWNRFDFTIVMISFIGVAIEESGSTIGLNPTILRVLRVFRIFRILRAFRIFKAAKGLQSIVDTLFKSLPAIGNLAGMLGLLFFIFGIMSVELFGSLCLTDDYQGLETRCQLINPLDLMDSHTSFKNIPMSLMTLFRISTTDNWGDIMNSCKLTAGPRPNDYAAAISKAKSAIAAQDWVTVWQLFPGCQSQSELLDLGIDCGELICESNCGSRIVAPMLFSAFLAVANFVLLNLVIAVLMQQLAESENSAWQEDMVNERLSRATLARIYWRWRINARVYTARCVPQAALTLAVPAEENISSQELYKRRRASLAVGSPNVPMVSSLRRRHSNTGENDAPGRSTPLPADISDGVGAVPMPDAMTPTQIHSAMGDSVGWRREPASIKPLSAFDDVDINSPPVHRESRVSDTDSDVSGGLRFKPVVGFRIDPDSNLPPLPGAVSSPVVISQTTTISLPMRNLESDGDSNTENIVEYAEAANFVPVPMQRTLITAILPQRASGREVWASRLSSDDPTSNPTPPLPPLLNAVVAENDQNLRHRDQDIAREVPRDRSPSPTSWDEEETRRLMAQKFVAPPAPPLAATGEDDDESDSCSDDTSSQGSQHPDLALTSI